MGYRFDHERAVKRLATAEEELAAAIASAQPPVPGLAKGPASGPVPEPVPELAMETAPALKKRKRAPWELSGDELESLRLSSAAVRAPWDRRLVE